MNGDDPDSRSGRQEPAGESPAPEDRRRDTGTDPDESSSPAPLAAEDVERLRALIAQLESGIPAPYRGEVLRFLLPRVLESGSAPAAPAGRPEPSEAADRAPEEPRPAGIERRRIDLAPFSELLSRGGKNLLKALVALEVARAQLGVEWMTPSEIERFLTERARVRSIYRTNLSNALRTARDRVDRRRRGRGYEYRITESGRALLRRELKILGP